MLLPLPNLDDRRWADLVEEGRSLIPVYAPDWTNYNISDPGITILDLLAWIGEMDIYQLNRIPERNKYKFLALVGVHPWPPRAAHTVLSFTLKDGLGITSLDIPVSAEFEGSDPYGVVTRFRMLEAVTVVPGALQAIQYTDSAGFHDLTRRWQRGETLSLLGDDPQVGSALYLGFSQALPVGVPVNLFFTFWDFAAGDQERANIIAELKAQRESCEPPDVLVQCQPDGDHEDGQEYESYDGLAHHSVRTVWEFLKGPNQWQPLDSMSDQIDDETRAFTLNGRVRVNLPAAMYQTHLGQVKTDLYYLRCRCVTGAYDAPPMLNSIQLNSVLAEQAVPVGNLTLTAPGHPDTETEVFGTGSGRPLQHFTTSANPVQQSSVHLYTIENGTWQEWKRRPDFDASRREDLHFVLEPTLGLVTFGDGENGRVPPAGARIVISYRATRAEAGNLAANSITQLSNQRQFPNWNMVKDSLAKITNAVPAEDGAAAETLAHAEGRAVERVNTTQRAVTLDDCEQLALTTPGIRLARATARANLHPAFPCFQAPGMIALIVLPYLPREEPTPSSGLLRAVSLYLRRRRVVGTRIEVVGPVYVQVTVKAQVQALTGVNTSDLQKRIIGALNAFFDPLSGGANGTGWDFGRDVYRTEVMQVIDGVPGVDKILSLDLIVGNGDPQCGNICLPPNGLVASGQHQIAVVGGGGACPA